MNYDKLTQGHLDHGEAHDQFIHLQNTHGLSPEGKGRVDEAMTAALEHVSKQNGLTLGMSSKHVDDALHYLDTKYEGRHQLLPKEREVIEKSFHNHFGTEIESPA